jgi:hypothetical protein
MFERRRNDRFLLFLGATLSATATLRLVHDLYVFQSLVHVRLVSYHDVLALAIYGAWKAGHRERYPCCSIAAFDSKDLEV